MENKNTLIKTLLIIVILVLLGILVYSIIQLAHVGSWVASDGIVSNVPTSTTTPVTAPVQGNKYTNSSFGYSFYYPSSWNYDGSMGIRLSNFGPYKNDDMSDTISVKEVEGSKVVVQDAKFGNTTLYYDETNKQWMVNAPDENEEYATSVAHPAFTTLSGVPVFSSTGRWRTFIVALSHSRFLVINISGSGFTETLEPFVKTVVSTGSDVSVNTINAAIKAESDSEIVTP